MMLQKNTFIKAIIGLMILLIMSRIRSFMMLGFDVQIAIFMIVEIAFLVWGVWVLKRGK